MYEAYAATLVGVVSAAVAIWALRLSRSLAPLPYTAVHVAAILIMILLVTWGYAKVPVLHRYPHDLISRLIYIGVSWLMFVNTLVVHWRLNRPKPAGTPTVLPE
ncbi:hypothetical protein [Candidatus Nitrospira bockiana]